jgi:hypothetical protein
MEAKKNAELIERRQRSLPQAHPVDKGQRKSDFTAAKPNELVLSQMF